MDVEVPVVFVTMDNRVIDVLADPPVYSLGKRHQPLASVSPGDIVRFHTTDLGYKFAMERGLEADPQTIQRLNALTGPVEIVGAHPGDVLETYIAHIELGSPAYVVYIDRWGKQTFGMESSWIRAFQIEGDEIALDNDSRVRVRPMIGCAGVAPSTNTLSSLSPTRAEGGNMDLPQLEAGATLLLPVAVEGGLFALGDLHAAMGKGEPAGAGFECAGVVSVRFAIRKGLRLSAPRIETDDEIMFLGSDPLDLWVAKQRAIESARRFLRDECEVGDARAFSVVSGLLQLELGGPAGGNVLATFKRADLAHAGVRMKTA